MKFKCYAVFLLLYLFHNGLNAQIVRKPWNQPGIKDPFQFTIASLNDKWGLIDDNGKVYLPFIYDSINYVYDDVFRFTLYKRGKVGLAHQFDLNSDDPRGNKIVRVIEPAFDSLHQKLFFVKAYKDSLMALYWYDGALLLPFATTKDACFIMFDWPTNGKRNSSDK